jgi:PilZ domain
VSHKRFSPKFDRTPAGTITIVTRGQSANPRDFVCRLCIHNPTLRCLPNKAPDFLSDLPCELAPKVVSYNQSIKLVAELDSESIKRLWDENQSAVAIPLTIADSRRQPRLKMETDIRIYSRSCGLLKGRTVDISESGIAAMLTLEAPVGEKVELEFAALTRTTGRSASTASFVSDCLSLYVSACAEWSILLALAQAEPFAVLPFLRLL